MWVDDLIEAANSRGIIFSSEELTALRSATADSAVARWAEDNIRPDKILSTEEFQIWKEIRQAQSNTIIPDSFDNIYVPESEEELKTAISSLEASTQAIKSQTRILKFQGSTLAAQKDELNLSISKHQTHEHYVKQKEASETQHIQFKNAEELSELKSRIRLEFEKVDRQIKALPSVAMATLNSNDRLLENIKLDQPQSNEDTFDIEKDQDRINTLSRALQKLQVEALQDRLDRTYLENILASTDDENQEPNDIERLVTEVEQDLKSLYAEIEDVNWMLVSQQYYDPLSLKVKELQHEQTRMENHNLDTKIRTLTTLTSQLQELATKSEQLHSHKIALQEISRLIDGLELSSAPPHLSSTKHKKDDFNEDNPIATLARDLSLPISDRTTSDSLYDLAISKTGEIREVNNETIQKIQQIIISALSRRNQAIHMLLKETNLPVKFRDDVDLLEEQVTNAKSELENITIRPQ